MAMRCHESSQHSELTEAKAIWFDLSTVQNGQKDINKEDATRAAQDVSLRSMHSKPCAVTKNGQTHC